jgi:hypothetical protein
MSNNNTKIGMIRIIIIKKLPEIKNAFLFAFLYLSLTNFESSILSVSFNLSISFFTMPKNDLKDLVLT